MPEDRHASLEGRAAGAVDPERALKSFRYLVSSINESALGVWTDLWRELQQAATPQGLVDEADRGFPSCGWTELLEKMWLLKHYLDSIQRFCK